MSEGLNLKTIIKLACKKFGVKEQASQAKIYNRNGVLLFESDFNLIAHGDILYIALKGKWSNNTQLNHFILLEIGEDFNYCAILDDYEIGKTLGKGGFGEVVLGRHKENKTEVAIKFEDVGEKLSSANLM